MVSALYDLGELKAGYYGLLEPKSESTVLDPALLEVVILPGLAFDLAGNRLGEGRIL